MSAFLADQEVAARVLRHIADGTTDRGDAVWREPVANYRSDERLDRELAMLRRLPIPFCPAAALPTPGSYLAREAAGTPLVAVRGRDEHIRVFRNACRHRGTQLVDGTGSAPSLACPYHGWTYRLDGRLHHVPHADGFPGLDQSCSGLVPVAAEEHAGVVFVTQEAASDEPTPSEVLAELLSDGQEILNASTNEAPVNWKLFLEGFLEGYHIRSTHEHSFYPYGYDNLNLVEHHGRHSRVTFPFRRIEKLADVAPEARRVDGLLTYVYHLFPNAMVTVLSRHTNLLVLEPLTVDRTRVLTWTLANTGRGTEATAAAKRDAAFVGQNGVAEDLAVLMAVQRGVTSGANEHLTFGHFESAIVHFHRCLRQELHLD